MFETSSDRLQGLGLVTGATGLVGFHIVHKLLERGRRVRALARSPDKARALLPEAVEIVQGDVEDPASLEAALDGCATVFHAAGLPEQWRPDDSIFDRVNAEGTRAMAKVALEAGVDRFVLTSTIDVFASEPRQPFDESRIEEAPKGTAYQRSKQKADAIVVEAMAEGLPAVFVHPAGCYGPGPTAPQSLNDFICRIRDGKIPALLPGAMPVVYAPDVAEVHVRAEERAQVGERFIVSESFFELRGLAEAIAEAAGVAAPRATMPLWLAGPVSSVGEAISSVIKRPPLIPAGQLHFMKQAAPPSADRAKAELDWAPTPFSDGVKATLASLAEEQAA